MHFPSLKLLDKVEERSLFFHDELTRIAFSSTVSNLLATLGYSYLSKVIYLGVLTTNPLEDI